MFKNREENNKNYVTVSDLMGYFSNFEGEKSVSLVIINPEKKVTHKVEKVSFFENGYPQKVVAKRAFCGKRRNNEMGVFSTDKEKEAEWNLFRREPAMFAEISKMGEAYDER